MKKILITSVIALCAMASQASYLAWQVGSGITADADSSVQPLSYDNANIYAINDSSGEKTRLTSYLQDGTEAGENIKAPMSVPLYADITDYNGAGYSYYIELSNYSESGNNSFVAGMVSNTSYANLSASITADLPTTSSLAVTIWHGGSYTAAPEPTSAILMLFGAAMLGLKRKNRSLN